MTKATTKPAAEPQLPALLSEDEFTAALRNSGFLPTSAGGSDINRLVVKGTNVKYGDEVIGFYNPKTKEPALIVQLAGSPKQYQALWFSKGSDDDPQSNAGLAEAIGRPEIAGRFCKSHFDDPTEARRYSESGASCDECPVHPFVPRDQLPPEAKGKKCAWKADLEFWILDKQDDGTFARTDETLYTMTLSTTGIIEFVGSSSKKRDNLAGSVSPMHTMARIAKVGMQKWGVEGIQKAKTYLELGGVICGLHILEQENKQLGRSWTVPSFDPLDILEIDDQAQLETSEDAGEPTASGDLPF